MDRIAILMPGDMGHGVGRALRAHGHDVITCLAGRSKRTCGLAADLILSILPPNAAVAQARAVAAAMTATGARPVYVDCNAVSPMTVREAAALIAAAGAPFIDCGIIGVAPGKGKPTRFHVSGPDTTPMEHLLKMVYAGLTKGTMTLHTAMLLAAHQLGVYDETVAEFTDSQALPLGLHRASMRVRLRSTGSSTAHPSPPKPARRWICHAPSTRLSRSMRGI
jgi:hypothetical protein